MSQLTTTFVRRFNSTHASLPPLPPLHRSRTRLALYACSAATAGVAGLYFFLPDARRAAPTSSTVPLGRRHWTPVTVTSTVPFEASATKLITLKLPQVLIPRAQDNDSLGPVFSVFVKDDDIQVERPYTPLTGIEANGDIHLWVKRYPRGEVGRWLHGKREGEQIEIRGPDRTWDLQNTDDWDEIVMISGGTGLTPFYQLLHHRFGRQSPPDELSRRNKTHFTLLHSSPSVGALPPAPLLDMLKRFANDNSQHFTFRLFTDTLHGAPEDAAPRRIGDNDIRQCLEDIESRRPRDTKGTTRSILFVVCGPDPMISALAGPKLSDRAQGPVGGTLGRMGFGSANVLKL